MLPIGHFEHAKAQKSVRLIESKAADLKPSDIIAGKGCKNYNKESSRTTVPLLSSQARESSQPHVSFQLEKSSKQGKTSLKRTPSPSVSAKSGDHVGIAPEVAPPEPEASSSGVNEAIPILFSKASVRGPGCNVTACTETKSNDF